MTLVVVVVVEDWVEGPIEPIVVRPLTVPNGDPPDNDPKGMVPDTPEVESVTPPKIKVAPEFPVVNPVVAETSFPVLELNITDWVLVEVLTLESLVVLALVPAEVPLLPTESVRLLEVLELPERV